MDMYVLGVLLLCVCSSPAVVCFPSLLVVGTLVRADEPRRLACFRDKIGWRALLLAFMRQMCDCR